MNPTDREHKHFDVLDNPKGGATAHLSWVGQRDAWGSWYTLCGRVTPSYRAVTLADTDHERVCSACERKAVKAAGRR